MKASIIENVKITKATAMQKILDTVPGDGLVHFMKQIEAGRATGVAVFIPLDNEGAYDPHLNKMAILFGKGCGSYEQAVDSFLSMFTDIVRFKVFVYQELQKIC